MLYRQLKDGIGDSNYTNGRNLAVKKYIEFTDCFFCSSYKPETAKVEVR